MQSIAETASEKTRARPLRNNAAASPWKTGFQATILPLGMSVRIATVCLAIYWLILFIGTHLPASTVPKMHLDDKLLHFGAFAGLAFLLSWAIPTRQDRLLLHVLVVLTIVVAYGCVDEVSQRFIPGRFCSFADLLADILGATTGILVYLVSRKMLSSTKIGRRVICLLSR